MSGINAKITAWYAKLLTWQKKAMEVAFSHSDITDVDKTLVFNMFLSDAKIVDSSFPKVADVDFNNGSTDEEEHFFIDTLSEIKGVGAIEATNPLSFHEKLSIVYGENGSGKSSYIRLLKNMCGSKGATELKGNIFSDTECSVSAKIVLRYQTRVDEIIWTPSIGVHNELRKIQIYDSDNAVIYANQDSEIIYEPAIIRALANVVAIYDYVAIAGKDYLDQILTSTQRLKEEVADTKIVAYIDDIKETDITDKIIDKFTLNENEIKEKILLEKSLNVSDPEKEYKKLQESLTNLQKRQAAFVALYNNLNDDTSCKIQNAKINSVSKAKSAREAAEKAFYDSNLDGVGTDTWKALWEAARKYSNELAYPQKIFPDTSDSKCVLCHQTLSADASNQMRSFEEFVQSTLEKESKAAEKQYLDLIMNLPTIDPEDTIIAKLIADGLSDYKDALMPLYMQIINRRAELSEWDTGKIISVISQLDDIIKKWDRIKTNIESQISALKESMENRSVQESKLKEFIARETFIKKSETIQAIIDYEKCEKALRGTNTSAVTNLCSGLAQELITENFISKFQDELSALGASHIKIELKTTTKKGKTLISVVLRNTKKKVKTKDILSEGEFRIVSLAVFLAETAIYSKSYPIIFDDPISSLDNLYEEKVAERIAKLSQERQVIAFTHRLAFAQMLDDKVDKIKDSKSLISLRHSPLGEPEDKFPITSQKPKAAINSILQEIGRLDKLNQAKEYASFDSGIKALCSDIRIMIEAGIETTLLHGVVKRYSRKIQTQQLRYLKGITKSDVVYFDDMMTKYSFEEHSQPTETPRPTPKLEDIKTDMENMSEYLDGLKKRQDDACK